LSGLLAAAFTSTRDPSTARIWVRPGAIAAGARPVYSGGTSVTDTSFSTGGGTTATATLRMEDASSPAATENANGRVTVSIRPRKIPPSTARSDSVTTSP